MYRYVCLIRPAEMIYLVADTFPRQQARTQRFTLGVPRSFQISPDGSRVAFLRSRGGADPVTCLWVLDVATAEERLVADPAELGTGEADPEEKARRERFRERASGIVSFAADAALRTAAFGLGGRVYAADLTAAPGPAARVRELGTLTPAADPRPDPTGRLVAYVHSGALRVIDLASGQDTAVAAPGDSRGRGHVRARRIRGRRGDGPPPRLLVGARRHGAARREGRRAPGAALVYRRPGPPGPAPRSRSAIRSRARRTPIVSLVLARARGEPTPVAWDRAAFPYLVTACWDGVAPETPLIVVQTSDQREMRVLAVDAATGATAVVRTDTDPHWLEIVRGVPARTADGRIVWTADAGGARRLLVATAGDLAAGAAEPVTPATLQVREILSVDGDTVLFTASETEPTEIGVWAYHDGRLEQVSDGPGVATGTRAGGDDVITSRSLESAGTAVRVLRPEDGAPGGPEVARITSLAERPLLPDPRPDIFAAGASGIRTALLLPSWHRPGSARLPVLMDPYGGPATQMVLASRAAFLTSQWFAEQGFAVVVADGRGTPGRGPEWERTVAGDLARLAVEDQVGALRAAAARCADLDVSRVGIRGWSFGGYLAALAVVRRPDVFHAAVAGAPVTDWRMYDTHATERYLGHPDTDGDHYDASSVLTDAHRLSRPLLLVHGLADDNVAIAHSLRLSSALLAAGRPHAVLPLSGITHMPVDERVAENMLLLQLDFLRQALGVRAPGSPAESAR